MYIIISLAVILLGVLSALLVSYLKRRSKYTPQAPVMQISPAQKARKELALLRKTNFGRPKTTKCFRQNFPSSYGFIYKRHSIYLP
ncbi:MAG: hypothetical protein HWD63_00255 [Candidatus Parvibacillus calidus]|nr:MAG: hypothetical protein HWD63_00255 [Candidatus Parvibacillus calidus]